MLLLQCSYHTFIFKYSLNPVYFLFPSFTNPFSICVMVTDCLCLLTEKSSTSIVSDVSSWKNNNTMNSLQLMILQIAWKAINELGSSWNRTGLWWQSTAI